MNYKTSKGLALAYVKQYSGEGGLYGFSGRVRVVSDDPSRDQTVRWSSNMQPINHEYGQLVRLQGVKHDDVNGFNIFRSLIKQQSNKQS